jgi:hypothetical protein
MTLDSADRNQKTTTFLQDAKDFMRDIAEWVLNGDINLPITSDFKDNDENLNLSPKEWDFVSDNPDLTVRWFTADGRKVEEHYPILIILANLGYLYWEERHTPNRNLKIGRTFYLTDKAWALLDKPRDTPNLFISYKRGVSSELALLIEARLRLVGADPDNIFVDRHIKLGDEWAQLIEAKTRGSSHFISLIGPGSLDSPYVRQEIEWALEDPARRIIPILHREYTIQKMIEEQPDLGERLASKQVHIIDGETAAKYEEGINYILHSLGYRTY